MKHWIRFVVMLSSTVVGAEEKPAANVYDVSVNTTPASPKVGDSIQYNITITPIEPQVLKVETPFKTSLSATAGLKLEQEKFASKDFVDPKTAAKSLQTKAKVLASGKQAITAEMSFFLCTKEICQRYEHKVQHELNVP